MAQTSQLPANVNGRPLRVAVVTDGLYPWFKGGKEVRYHELLRRLADEDVHIDVYTMHWWDGPRQRQQEGVHLHAICRNWPMYAGERRSLLQAIFFALACCRLLFIRADVIDADHMPYLQIVPLKVISVLRRIPLVVTWHEWWGSDYWRSYLGAAGPVAAAIERLTASLADHLVVEAADTATAMVDAGIAADRISVLPCGVDKEAIAEAEPSGTAFDILYVGRLLEHKGVDTLVDAVPIMDASGVTLTVGIVGEGPEQVALEAQVGRLGLGRRVQFLGRLETQREVFGLIKQARVFVLPSRREGFGIVVVEALACGTAVVTTDHPDNQSRHQVEDGVTGYVVAPSADALADAVLRSLADGRNGEVIVKAADIHDWDDLAADLVGIYRAHVRTERT